jgi:chaperonin GroES
VNNQVTNSTKQNSFHFYKEAEQKIKETNMAKISIRPLDDRVVVEPMAAEETTAGGIVLPDAAQEKPQRGTVVAVGPGKLLESGERGELSIGVGDEVIYGKYGGTEIEVDGQDVKILRESDILAKVV